MNRCRVAVSLVVGALLCPAGLGQPPSADESREASILERLNTETLRLAQLGDSALPYEWVKAHLNDTSWTRPAISLFHIDRLPKLGYVLSAGEERARISLEARDLLRRMERAFIISGFDTISLLPQPEQSRYDGFDWDADDYPGGPVGPHEDMALALDAALARIRPERRANSTATAVVRESEFNDEVWKYIESEERPVAGQETRKLNRWALASFVTMREAAKRDGVDIVILSSNRLPTTAAANAARTGNAYAVARFSSHILGLAMDIRMSDDQMKLDETTTRPMSNIISMRSSPVHKWMFVHGAAYGWYPYTHEPWHWEYNPPGFRERFWNGYPGGKL